MHVQERFPIVCDHRINYRGPRQLEVTRFRGSDHPQVRVFLPSPVKKKRRRQLLRDLLRRNAAQGRRGGAIRGCQAFSQRARPAELSDIQSIKQATVRTKEIDVAFVEFNGARKEGHAELFLLDGGARRFDGLDCTAKFSLRLRDKVLIGVDLRETRLRLPAKWCFHGSIVNYFLKSFFGLVETPLACRNACGDDRG